eukprot:scaffold296201_cov67-Attheya_sp.AAC.1
MRMTWMRIVPIAMAMMMAVGMIRAQEDQDVNAIIDWVRSKDGYVNQNIEIRRRIDASDTSTYNNNNTRQFGVFAREALDTKEP